MCTHTDRQTHSHTHTTWKQYYGWQRKLSVSSLRCGLFPQLEGFISCNEFLGLAMGLSWITALLAYVVYLQNHLSQCGHGQLQS